MLTEICIWQTQGPHSPHFPPGLHKRKYQPRFLSDLIHITELLLLRYPHAYCSSLLVLSLMFKHGHMQPDETQIAVQKSYKLTLETALLLRIFKRIFYVEYNVSLKTPFKRVQWLSYNLHMPKFPLLG